MWGEKGKSTKQMNGSHKPTSSVNYAGMFAIMIPYPHSHNHEFWEVIPFREGTDHEIMDVVSIL